MTWLNEELMPEYWWKKNIKERWKQRWTWKEEYWKSTWACRAGVRKTKAHRGLKLAKGMIGSKSFYYYFRDKVINKEIQAHCWVRQQVIGTQCFFCLSSLNCSPRVRGAEEIQIVEQDLAKYLLKSFNPSKSMGPDGMHPRVQEN